MKQLFGDLFDFRTYRLSNGKLASIQPDIIGITTNGFCKKSGEADMGKGCAKTAASMDPRIPLRLGRAIQHNGNHVHELGLINGVLPIVSFPVKPIGETCKTDKSNVVRHMKSRMIPGQLVPGWACVASIEIIKRSARELLALTEAKHWSKIVLPRAGCGCGELCWEDVYKHLNKILDDRFYNITYGGLK